MSILNRTPENHVSPILFITDRRTDIWNYRVASLLIRVPTMQMILTILGQVLGQGAECCGQAGKGAKRYVVRWGGGEGGTQIFNIKKKISKRNIPNFFACHDGRKCLNYFDLVRAESSLVISFQNLMCWHNLTQQIFPKLPANGATPPENQVFYRKCKKEYNQRTHTTKKKLIKIC